MNEGPMELPSLPDLLRQGSGSVLALLLLLSGTTIGAASPLRVATLNVEFGLGEPGTTSFEATADVLERIDADVVALQEMTRADFDGTPSSFRILAADLGYPYVHAATTQRVLDSGLRTAFMTRYPLISTFNIASPPGALDMVRQIPAIVVDIPGTVADPTILTLHLKCCLDIDDPFRRAVELKRSADFLSQRGLTAEDNVIILGDFNLIGGDFVYNEIPPGLPRSFILGEDIAFPVNYYTNPADYFQQWSIDSVGSTQLNGSANTQGSSQLDFILATHALRNRPFAGEIYNSALDVDNQTGLPKAGPPLSERTSSNASDHLAVFADFNLTSRDSLVLRISTPEVAESDPSGSAFLTIELPSPPDSGETIEVLLTSSDPGEAVPVTPSVLFVSGQSIRTVDISPQLDGLVDGSREVLFTASATGFSPATAQLRVTDSSSGAYTISNMGQPVVETFENFEGLSPPLRWTISGGPWRGTDTGTLGMVGLYSFGNDGSLGFLLNSEPFSAMTSFRNDTESVITALEIAYDAEQWRSFSGERSDVITVEASVAGKTVALPDLSFTTNPPPGIAGPVANGITASLTSRLENIFIPPGATFELNFTISPGQPFTNMEDYVRLNEFHYDNAGADLNEFIEILIAPGYQGSSHEIEVYLYNGNGGGVYGQHPLTSFTLDQILPSGHRIYSKLIPRIQNGPDGIALVVNNEIVEFVSYEGTVTATEGPADGLTSNDIGVAQSNPVPTPGTGSLGLNDSLDWIRFVNQSTPGQLNEQQLPAPALIPGIALDNLSVTATADRDNDGIPDHLEERLGTNPLLLDSDNDGIPDGEEDADGDTQSNLAEILVTETDPLDPSSRFALTVAANLTIPGESLLSYSTLPGRTYTIFRSIDLVDWQPISSSAGTGRMHLLSVAPDPRASSSFYRVEVTVER